MPCSRAERSTQNSFPSGSASVTQPEPSSRRWSATIGRPHGQRDVHGLVAGPGLGLEVEVHPVLGGLALGHRDEEEPGAVEGVRRRHHDLGIVVVVDVPARHRRPERRQAPGVGAVEGDVVDANAHAATLAVEVEHRQPGSPGAGTAWPRPARRTVCSVPCDYCGVEFDPISTRWLCPHCHMKANCCDGAPLDALRHDAGPGAGRRRADGRDRHARRPPRPAARRRHRRPPRRPRRGGRGRAGRRGGRARPRRPPTRPSSTCPAPRCCPDWSTATPTSSARSTAGRATPRC